MAKRHGRPSAEYRYEHYDPRDGSQPIVLPTGTPGNSPPPAPQDTDDSPKDGGTD